jgi:hypothetical protein
MARTWIGTFTENTQNAQGTTVKKYVVWGIPVDTFTAFGLAFSKAQEALTHAQEAETRTPVANQQCRTAFDALSAAMRDIKKRYFYVPPLVDADFIALGLKLKDTIPTPSGTPTAQVTTETYLIGRHQLGVKIIYVTGNPADAANKGYRIWYSVITQGETAPANPDDLRKSFFTKRKKDVIDFGFGDSGKTAYFAVQIENEGKKGPWGPLVSALIP